MLASSNGRIALRISNLAIHFSCLIRLIRDIAELRILPGSLCVRATERARRNSGWPNQGWPNPGWPDRPTLDGLVLDGPTLDGPTLDGATLDGPTPSGSSLPGASQPVLARFNADKDLPAS